MSTARTLKPVGVKLDLIRLDGDTQPRTEIDHALVAEYVEFYDSIDFPPIDVFFDGKSYWLVDGFHRWFAARNAGETTITCIVHKGTLEDARWFSYAANQTHGLRRSNADKGKAVRSALRHPNGANLSDGQIAEHIGVSDRMVAKYRAELTPKFSESEVRVGRDGRTINTAKIGRAKLSKPPDDSAPADPPPQELRDGLQAEAEPQAEPVFDIGLNTSVVQSRIRGMFAKWPERYRRLIPGILIELSEEDNGTWSEASA